MGTSAKWYQSEVALGEYAFLGIATDKLLHKSGEGYREAEHGTVPALIELAAFHLYPFFGKSDNRDSGNVSAISNLLEELNKIRGFATAFSVDYEDKELALLQVRAQLWAESVRGSAYPPQTRHRIERIQGPHEEWFRGKVGIGPLRAVEILNAFEGLANHNLADKRALFGEFMEKMFDFASRGVGTGKSSDFPVDPVEVDQKAEEFNGILEGFSEGIAISFNQLASVVSDLSEGEWTALKNLIGLSVENRPAITHPRELRKRPVYFLSENRVLVSDLSSAFDAVFEAFDDVTRSDSSNFRDAIYVKEMASWMENEVSSYLLRIFPQGNVFLNLTYPDPDNPGGETELDGAVLWGPFLILVEIKGTQFSESARHGNPSKLRKDFKKSIGDAFDQTIRANRYISSKSPVVFREKGTTRQLVVKNEDIRRIYPVSVTLHHFGGMATQLSMVSRLGLFKEGTYPWSLSLSDLDIVTRFSGSPDVFLHYAQRRIELQESQEQILGDELDVFGQYLDDRLHPSNIWGREPEKGITKRLFHFGGGSERFDEWYQAQSGLIEKAPDIRLDVPPLFLEILLELRRLNDDGARWIAFALLGLSNAAVSGLVEAVENVKKNRVGDGRVGRATFVEGDLVVSILGGVDIPESELRKQVISRCTKEKYRLKKYSSIALGMRVDDILKPFAFACWLEGPWEENAELQEAIDKERPKLLPGTALPGRNDRCPCGSRKKFKKCCINKYKNR